MIDMHYFGPPGDAPVYDSIAAAPAPLGEPCVECGEAIVDGERGFLIPYVHEHADGDRVSVELPWHRLCFLGNIIGGLPS